MSNNKPKVDYINKQIKDLSREQLLDAIKEADEKNKQIDEKSKISSKSLAVRAGK
jgi:hypothetical protein